MKLAAKLRKISDKVKRNTWLYRCKKFHAAYRDYFFA